MDFEKLLKQIDDEGVVLVRCVHYKHWNSRFSASSGMEYVAHGDDHLLFMVHPEHGMAPEPGVIASDAVEFLQSSSIFECTEIFDDVFDDEADDAVYTVKRTPLEGGEQDGAPVDPTVDDSSPSSGPSVEPEIEFPSNDATKKDWVDWAAANGFEADGDLKKADLIAQIRTHFSPSEEE